MPKGSVAAALRGSRVAAAVAVARGAARVSVRRLLHFSSGLSLTNPICALQRWRRCNAGTGKGTSVLEMVRVWEKVTGTKVAYEVRGPTRDHANTHQHQWTVWLCNTVCDETHRSAPAACDECLREMADAGQRHLFLFLRWWRGGPATRWRCGRPPARRSRSWAGGRASEWPRCAGTSGRGRRVTPKGLRPPRGRRRRRPRQERRPPQRRRRRGRRARGAAATAPPGARPRRPVGAGPVAWSRRQLRPAALLRFWRRPQLKLFPIDDFRTDCWLQASSRPFAAFNCSCCGSSYYQQVEGYVSSHALNFCHMRFNSSHDLFG